MPVFLTMCFVLVVIDVAILVMIQMYFEGHEAFNGIEKI